MWCWAARHAADLEDAAADLELNTLLGLLPERGEEATRFARAMARYQERLLLGAGLVRDVVTAPGPEGQADAAGANPDLFFFAPLAVWSDESPHHEQAARALCETLLARAGVMEVRADWPETIRSLLYGCAWFVGRQRWFPEPVEVTRAMPADRRLQSGWYRTVMREAVAAAGRDRQPRIGLAVLNALYALADRAADSGPDGSAVPRGPLVRASLFFVAVELQEQLALAGEAAVFEAIRRALESAIGLCESIVADPILPEEREDAVNLLGLCAARRAGVSVNDPEAGRRILERALAVMRDTPAGAAVTPRCQREAALLLRLCHLDLRERHYDGAEERLRRAAELAGATPSPDLAERLQYFRAKLHVLRGDYDAAEQCFFPRPSGEESA
jgi:hypothetical protein